MKIKKSTFYALRLIYRMHREDGGVITSVELAEKENLSPGVTMKILRELARAGMLEVHQGRGKICGGFSLEKSIDKITLLDVITVSEGVDICINLIGEPDCEEESKLHRTCTQINEQLNELLCQYTIRELFEPAEKHFSGNAREQVINTFKVVI